MIPKFRAWDNVNKKIVDVVNIDYQVRIIETYSNHSKNTDYFGFSEVELMQSTGLKDNNGVEIYEGDIVEWKHIRMCVSGLLEVKRDFPMWLVKHDEFEVIGNVYENPELLEDKV